MALLGACAFNFFNNLGEELVYRGYAFVRLADRFGPYFTVVALASLFALLHLQAGLPWVSVLTVVFTSGLVFGAIFARWRSVPLTLGFHVATNVVQALRGCDTSSASLFAPHTLRRRSMRRCTRSPELRSSMYYLPQEYCSLAGGGVILLRGQPKVGDDEGPCGLAPTSQPRSI